MRERRHAPLSNSPMPQPVTPHSSSQPFSLSVMGILRIIVSVLRGLFDGALPIIILVAILGLFWEFVTISRYVTAQFGYSVAHSAQTVVALGGLVASLIVFLVAGMRTLRNAHDRQLEGDYVESSVAMLVLAISLLILFIAVMNTIGMPLHPAA